LPISYVVDYSEPITYIDKRVTSDILNSLSVNFEDLDSQTKKVLQICDILKPEMLFKKFSKNIKAAKKIEDLIKDSKIEFGLKQFINSNLDVFLNLINEKRFPISLNLGSNKDFYKNQISTNNLDFKAKLQFDKTEYGITYSLYLKQNDVFYQPINHQIHIILDAPSWIVFDQKLIQIEAVNSKKLTPFFTKKSLEIPTKNIPEFFEKFIKDIVKKVDIEATGFEIIVKNKLKSCQIVAVHDFFKNSYHINLIFDYDGFQFDHSKSKNTHSDIDLSDIDNIKVIQYKRSSDEVFFINKIIENEFEITESGFFKHKNNSKSDPFETLQWLIDNRIELEKFGFSLSNLKIEGKKLITQVATIQQSNDLINDWFDIKMNVICGNFEFNFADIIPNIKNQNRLYHLPDNTVFLIPLEWLTTYATFAKVVQNDNGFLKLPKNNFSVLDQNSVSISVLNTNSKIEYLPSQLLKATLRPYQTAGVKWLLDHFNMGLGACLADDMGLGKTLQTLAVLVAVQEQLANQAIENKTNDLFGNEIIRTKDFLKTLIVLPSSLIFNWNNEAKKFTPHFSKIQYVGKDRRFLEKKLDRYDLIFTSYAILSRDITVFEKYNFRYLILDESQYIKNKNSKVFKAISQIKADNKISLSGTPIENSLDDLWSLMQFINPNILGSFKFFNENYKQPIQKKQDEIALADLKTIINPFILRRTKEQVLKDLPEFLLRNGK
jgi:non-specific serine/threonine protein kinase